MEKLWICLIQCKNLKVYFTKIIFRHFSGIIPGCNRVDQCVPSACSNGGKCQDLWTTFECKCPRPFLSPNCFHKLTEATFGHSNQSTLIEYSIDSKTSVALREITELSFLLRTNAKSGQILYLGEAETSSEFEELATTFLNAELEQGTFFIK